MKKLPVAVQLYSVREDAAADFAGTMKRIRGLGFDGVELAGLYGLTARSIRAVLDETGLTAISAHVPIEAMQDDMDQVLADYRTIGCRFLAVPWLPESMRPSSAGFDSLAGDLRRFGTACRDKGLTLLYHNHDFEFCIMPDGSFGLDAIFARVSADLLQTELDTCWIKYAGQDPVKYLSKYAGRAPVVHIKDYVPVSGGIEFRPVGSGVQDVPSLLEASVKAGADWIVVEQDDSSDRPPMDAIGLSLAFLKSLGW